MSDQEQGDRRRRSRLGFVDEGKYYDRAKTPGIECALNRTTGNDQIILPLYGFIKQALGTQPGNPRFTPQPSA